MASPQSYANHARIEPLYHYFLFALLLLDLGWTGYQLATAPSLGSFVAAMTAVALTLVAFYARAFALTVQDRVIRLEMRLRMKELLPADFQGRIGEFTPRQLVALRFAGDDELPSLARQVLDGNIQDGKVIKQMVQAWQADHLRV